MKLKKLANVVLGSLEDLHLYTMKKGDRDEYTRRRKGKEKESKSSYLANVAVLERVDTLRSLLDLSANDLGNELVNELLEIARGGLALNDLEHLLTDLTDLSRLGVGRLLDLVGAALGESNGEETNEVSIGGLDVRVGLDTISQSIESEMSFLFLSFSSA